jgi:hypothetical protein
MRQSGISRFSGAQLRTMARIFDAPRNDDAFQETGLLA